MWCCTKNRTEFYSNLWKMPHQNTIKCFPSLYFSNRQKKKEEVKTRSSLYIKTSKLILLLYSISGTSFTMMILIYRIVFLGNILLTWATLQQPYMSKTLLALPPQNKNDWIHSVIFEPQPKMLLTRSTYKIASFLDFQPFLQGFQSVDTYIKNLLIDIANPIYYDRLIAPFQDAPPLLGTNDSNVMTFLASPICRA